MKKLLLLLVLSTLFLGCAPPSKDSEKLLSDSAKKANSIESFAVEYRRVVVSYANPNGTIHMIPETVITKYKKGDKSRWDTRDWLNNSARLYKLKENYYSCLLNKTWACAKTEPSRMQEFLGFGVPDPEASVLRAVSEGALVLGEIKNETVYGRASNCLAIEIHPDRISGLDRSEFLLGSVEDSSGMNGLKAWECLDNETGLKTQVVLNYKGEVDGEQRTVEVNLKMSGFDSNPKLEDSMFELPGK